jgi:hemolysin-activating ACP:hemolysin acyltransferase
MPSVAQNPQLTCCQYDDPIYALGRAVELLRHRAPFVDYKFGTLSNVLMGQIRRGHFVFTEQEQTAIGYAGWALCDEDIARAWIRRERVPTYAQCESGNSWVGITFYAATKQVCFAQARWIREKYPNMKGFGLRDYGKRRRASTVVNRTPSQPAHAAS